MRVVCCLLLLLASQSALAEGFISRLLNHPVPGASPWWRSAARHRPRPPAIRASRCWWCVKRANAGLPSSASPQEPARRPPAAGERWPHPRLHGRHQALPGAAHQAQEQPSGQPAGRRHDPHQPRTGGTDPRLPDLQPDPAEQPAVRQTGGRPALQPVQLRRFFNGEERNPTPASTLRSVPAPPSSRRRQAR